MLAEKFNLAQKNISPSTQATFVNIGGISNLTRVSSSYDIQSLDCGPGMCLIDKWIRVNSKNRIDKDGKIAKKGNIDNKILWKYIKKIDKFFFWCNTFDINDFNIDLVKGLSLADGAATLTELTALNILRKVEDTSLEKTNFILCGGGRKNNFLIKRIEKIMTDQKLFKVLNLKMIDKFKIDGDFIESQAFACLAIRSYLKLPISFPSTTGCEKPCTGGVIVKNF